MTGCIGVFMISTGFRFEKPRPGNPCGVWAAGNYRGIRGFISTAGKFFLKITIWITWINLIIRVTKKKYFQRPKKTLKTPNTPFSRSDRALLLPTTTSFLHFEQENNAVVQITV
jgi:hypothetical protein